MTTTSINSSTPPNYTLREATNQKRMSPFSSSSSKRGRIELSPSKSATCVRDEGHNCENIEEIHTSTKVIARLHHSLFRFSLAYAFDCTTSRGTTIHERSQSPIVEDARQDMRLFHLLYMIIF
jgi:hypothetical protein